VFAVPALIILLAADSALLIAQRVRIQRSGAERVERGLADVDACAAWIREHTAPDAAGAASLARMCAFMSARAVHDGSESRAPAWIWLLGDLPGNPAFHEDKEQRLRAKVRDEGWVPLFNAGRSGVYRPPAAPAGG
jgi:hypothetical protein